MKNTSINIRVSEGLKNNLEQKGVENNIKVSDLIRSALYNIVSDKTEIEVSQSSNQKLEKLDLLQTLGFTEFVFWIYEKRRDPEKSEIDELYEQFINLIEELNHHPLFGEEVLREINKVKRELQDTLYGNVKLTCDFLFSNIENIDGFNYQVFANFIYSLRYDENNKRILNIK